MAETCRLSPVVFRRNGVNIEEVDSKLFQDIKKAVKDNDTAWKMWAYTKTTDFKTNYRNLEYDELGEVTFPSLIKALGFEDVYNDQKDAEEVSRDYGFTNTVFENSQTAINKIDQFNAKEKRFVAILQKAGDKYSVKVVTRNGANLDMARQQSYNYALTGEIINLLRSIGFNVDFVFNPRYKGIFDPTNATLHDGLLTIIRIAKGELGEQALPEEFSHLIIEGLINHPLVQRLLSTLNDIQVHEILGDTYEDYYEKYDKDYLKLKKEAAGKLLGQYISKQGTISRTVIQPKQPLLSRIWTWAKNLFSRITNKQLTAARQKANDAIADIYNLIASGEAITLIDKHNIISADEMYALEKEYDSILKVSRTGETITARMYKYEKRKLQSKASRELSEKHEKTGKALQEIRRLDGSDKHFESVNYFLEDVKRQLVYISKEQRKVSSLEETGTKDIKLINGIAKVIREIDDFLLGYKNIIDVLANFDELDDDDLAKLGIDKDAADIIAKNANECRKKLNKLARWESAVKRNIWASASRTVIPNDIVRGIGTKRNQVMCLEQILEHADRDTNVIDRWINAMSDSDDTFLQIFDALVKNQQYERDEEVREWIAEIANIDEKLRKAGISSDFMYERNKEDVPTGRILSIYDWDAYNEERKTFVTALREKQEKTGMSQKQFRDLYIAWKNGTDPKTHKPRLIRVYVDPKADALYKEQGMNKKAIAAVERAFPGATYEEMPNPQVYSGKVAEFERLCPQGSQKRAYYDEMIRIKRQMMTRIPHRNQGIYKAVYISKDFIEGIINNTTGNVFKATVEHYVKKFVRRPDEIGFGTSDNFPEIISDILKTEDDSSKAANKILKTLSEQIDDDIVVQISPNRIEKIIERYNRKVNSKKLSKIEAIKEATEEIIEEISSENFYIVETDFAGNRIQKLPIYYTRPLKDMRMLSTDFSGSIVAYTAMAVNYEKMNEVVDILEVGRDIGKERRTLENEGNKPISSKFTALDKVYRAYVEKASTLTGERIDDYMDSAVYEKRKDNEGTINILGTNIDTAKTLDAIKDYTGLLGLGLNVFSTFSNISVGKLQQWIEAVGGEYFTVKDYAKAIGQYNSLILGHIQEMTSPVKKNKLSLLIQMFDPMGDYYEKLRNPNYSKSAVSRILGNGILAYIGMDAGEHMLHCQTMLAILNNIKLINTKTKEKISLYDALEVKEVNGITKLVLQDNLAYERELIDNNGTPKSNKNYGRPVRDKDGKIKKELVLLIDSAESKNLTNFIFKKKKLIRKVNNSLNGAFSTNDKGAAHKKAVLRLVMQFRQWMPEHYARRFDRAHYDVDLEQWREGYYNTVIKTLNLMAKELKKSSINLTLIYKNLNEHERANLRRANTEIAEFITLSLLVRFGGKIKDRDRSWLEKMALYQIRRMRLEVGASMPGNPGFFSNIFQLLRSPMASLTTFENFSKVLQLTNMFDEIESGRYQGWTEWERDVFNLIPPFNQVYKGIAFDDSMFSQFEKNN